MLTLTISKARTKLYKLVDKIADSHEPIQITAKRHNAVLINEKDWRAIKETLYLLTMPDMRESIREGLKSSIKKCNKKLMW